ncbi:MAG: BON domain-containing protein [Blastocatellia bacterium]|nr:BON domain-containing protein [Blastocatellia bacterium]
MKLSFIAIVVALVISLTGCESRTATDATVTTAVKNKLAAEPTTSAARINVDTANGVVTLSGAVPTAAEKSEAERIARNTQGVTQVVNNITVESGGAPGTAVTPAPGGETGAGRTLSDATILTGVKTQLVAHGITGANVDVKNGVVTITGAVDDAQKKARAEEIARQASGVKSVNNQLTIKHR